MKIISKYIMFFMACFLQNKSYPYCIYFDNSNAVGNISLPVIIFSNAQEWKSLDESKEITQKVFEAVEKGGKAIAGDGGDNPAEQVVGTAKKIAEGVATGGTSEIIGTAAQVLAEPLKIAVDAIIKATKEKHKHFLTSGTTADCWDWKDIEPWGHDTAKTVFGVVFDQTDQTYLGTFVVDTRGEVHLKIDPTTKRLYLQIWGYDDSIAGTNLKKVFESVGWNTVGQNKPKKA